jgi:hypothetical protein
MLLLLISIGMVGLTVGTHTLGAAFWLKYMGKRLEYRSRMNQPPHLFRGILTTAMVLLMLHVLEAFFWALLYMQLPAQAGLKNLHDAFYFSLITFTTLGYGDITLDSRWQLLTGIEGMVGIVVFGLTTALLFAVIQKIWKFSQPKPETGG